MSLKEEKTVAMVDVTFADLKNLGDVECMAPAFDILRQKWVALEDPNDDSRETNVRSGTIFVGMNDNGTLCFEFVSRVKFRPGEFENAKKHYEEFFAERRARSGGLVAKEETP